MISLKYFAFACVFVAIVLVAIIVTYIIMRKKTTNIVVVNPNTAYEYIAAFSQMKEVKARKIFNSKKNDIVLGLKFEDYSRENFLSYGKACDIFHNVGKRSVVKPSSELGALASKFEIFTNGGHELLLKTEVFQFDTPNIVEKYTSTNQHYSANSFLRYKIKRKGTNDIFSFFSVNLQAPFTLPKLTNKALQDSLFYMFNLIKHVIGTDTKFIISGRMQCNNFPEIALDVFGSTILTNKWVTHSIPTVSKCEFVDGVPVSVSTDGIICSTDLYQTLNYYIDSAVARSDIYPVIINRLNKAKSPESKCEVDAPFHKYINSAVKHDTSTPYVPGSIPKPSITDTEYKVETVDNE